ncbi:MAG: transporter [Alphaproteobacteria bacterium]|nr:transporter [Alphaproteobacteria bacterium]
MKRTVFLAALLATTAGAYAQSPINWPQDINWQIDTGFDYSSGKYGGTEATDVLSVPVDLRLQMDRFRLEATMSYLDVKGPGVVAGGVVVGGTGPVTTRSGLGDLNVGAAFLLNKDGDAPAIELEGIVKVPTAGSGLGTGQYDYLAQVNLYHSFTPRFMLFGSAGYQWLTSFPTVALESGLIATGGANFKTSDDTSIGFTASYHQQYYAGLGDVYALSPYVLWNVVPNWRVTAYGTFGLSKASPDYGAGLRLIFYR